jgi:hypothetical protein
MRKDAGLALVVLAMWVAGAVPAGAADPRTHCRFASEVTLSPGLSVVPSSGSFTSDGENGTVECDGPVRGLQPVGPGTLGVFGRYGTKDPDTCFAGEGEGRFSFTFPTAQGTGKRSNVFTFSFSLVGAPSGGFEGDGFDGSFDDVRPEEGDCFVHPVTKVAIRGHGTITRQ